MIDSFKFTGCLAAVANSNFAPRKNSMILCIELPGHYADAVSLNDAVPGDEGRIFTTFAALTDELLKEVRPSVIVAPLFSLGFDAVDLAERLDALGYRGGFIAVTDPVPQPRLIEREIRRYAPLISFNLIQASTKAA